MCRLIEGLNAKEESERKVYGVLTDYDLSSWRKDLQNHYTRTSQQRTGTPPYMAQELLKGTSTTHLYRHDLESLFYIMLLMTARYTITPTEGGPNAESKGHVVIRGGKLPYQKWFNTQDYDTLGAIKKDSFFSSNQTATLAIELSPTFEAFRPWLKEMRLDFAKGFNSKNYHSMEEQESNWREKRARSASHATSTSAPFDDETLDGHVDYSTVIEPTRTLKGGLEDLIIRYDTKADTVQAGAGVGPQ